ncbi:g2678 [Coccomyxa viridis]|uniref:G2678 protein n=1 Tax=Coccomyxa viridis TaxID=1274662 RepID=A0ABP1FN98_9CHLO
MAFEAILFNTSAAIFLLAIALLGAYLPVLLTRLGKNSGAQGGRSLTYVLGNMLSAGVMVSAGFVHLLGAAIKELNPGLQFPLAPFLCGLGFLVTLVADHVAEVLSHRNGWETPPGHCGGATLDGEMTRLQHVLVVDPVTPRRAGEEGKPGTPVVASLAVRANGDLLRKTSTGLRVMLGTDALDFPGSRQHSGSAVLNGDGPGHKAGKDPEGAMNGESDEAHTSSLGKERHRAETPSNHQQDHEAGSAGSPEDARHDGDAHLETVHLVGNMPSSSEREPDIEEGKAGAKAEEAGTSGEGGAAQVSFLTAALMGVALCFHSILEGMAMGAQTNIVDSVHIFIAIAAHKGLAAYALGSSVVDSQASMQKFWTVIGFFATATPVGILLGVVLSSVSNSDAAAAVSALASGTFLYVAFMEVIPRELAVPQHRTAKLGMLMLGFAAMSLLAIWA